MKKFLTFLVLGLLWCNTSFSKDVKAAVWSNSLETHLTNVCQYLVLYVQCPKMLRQMLITDQLILI